MGKIQINVLGTSFSIQSDEDEVYMSKLFDYYKDIVKQLEQSNLFHDPLQLSIVAGINICDELYKSKRKAAVVSKHNENAIPEKEKAEKITLSLIDKLDSVL